MNSKSTKKLLSIIVPVYNASIFLQKCIDSILENSFDSFEAIFINDGSTDSSRKILDRITDSRVIVIHKNNSGVSSARNAGLQRAKGEYVLFIDADDYLTTNGIKDILNAIHKFRDADFIKFSHRVNFEGIEKKSKFKSQRAHFKNRYLSHDQALISIVNGHNVVWNICFRRLILMERQIFFDEELSYFEDGPFIFEFFSSHPQCVYVDEDTYVYRVDNEDSLTHGRINEKKCQSLINAAVRLGEIQLEDFESKNLLLCTISEYWILALKGILRFRFLRLIKVYRYMQSKCQYINASNMSFKYRILASIYNLIQKVKF